MNIKLLAACLLVAFLAACAGTEAASGRVIDNAGEMVKSGADVVWIDPAKRPTPTPTVSPRY